MSVKQMLRCMLIAAVAAATIGVGAVAVGFATAATAATPGPDPVSPYGALLALCMAASASLAFYYLFRS